MRPAEKSRLCIVALVALLGLALAVLFVGFARLDLAVTETYYLYPLVFILSRHPFALFVNAAMQWVTGIVVVALLAGMLWSWLGKRLVLSLGPRQYLYVFLCFAVGPGLIANTVFKENWGRARPMHTKEFGGTLQYTPPFVVSDQCKRNCSFISGDTASAFSFLAFALLAKRRRGLIAVAVVGFGTFIGAVRMFQGAHYLSDIVFAAVFATLTVLLLRELLLEDGCFARPLNAALRRLKLA